MEKDDHGAKGLFKIAGDRPRIIRCRGTLQNGEMLPRKITIGSSKKTVSNSVQTFYQLVEGAPISLSSRFPPGFGGEIHF